MEDVLKKNKSCGGEVLLNEGSITVVEYMYYDVFVT